MPCNFCSFKKFSDKMFWLWISSQKKKTHKSQIKKYHDHVLTLTIQSLQLFCVWTNSNKISCESYFLKRKKTFECKCIINYCTHTLPTNCIGKWFSTIKRPRSCMNSFCCTSSFWKRSKFVTKDQRLNFQIHYAFFNSCFHTSFKVELTSSSNLFAII